MSMGETEARQVLTFLAVCWPTAPQFTESASQRLWLRDLANLSFERARRAVEALRHEHVGYPPNFGEFIRKYDEVGETMVERGEVGDDHVLAEFAGGAMVDRAEAAKRIHGLADGLRLVRNETGRPVRDLTVADEDRARVAAREAALREEVADGTDEDDPTERTGPPPGGPLSEDGGPGEAP